MRQNKVLRASLLFALFGVLMLLGDLCLEALPNVHLVGVLLCVYTRVYRQKALIPLYLYVFLNGLIYGFGIWWLPYLYVWLPLWGCVMLLPKNLSKRASFFLLPAICALHGLLFGVLYAPAQALFFSLSFEATLLWIATGLPFDLIHAAANLCGGLLIPPLEKVLLKLEKQ